MKEFVQASETWTFMPTEVAFVRHAIQGIIISVLFALAILLVATRNYVISLISISCVVISPERPPATSFLTTWASKSIAKILGPFTTSRSKL